MYLFLIFGLPLGFLLLVLDAYPKFEFPQTGRAYAKGLASFVPVWLIARILGAIVPSAYGSFLLTFHEWADRLLPYSALPALAYLVFFKPGERLPPGAGARRLTAFYAGALSPVGLCESARIWGSSSPYALFFLPFLLGAICLLMPKAAARIHGAYGFGLAMEIAAVAAASFAASLCPFLLLARLGPLAMLLVAMLCLSARGLSYSELLRRPPVQIVDE
jgi:hypothetical protein